MSLRGLLLDVEGVLVADKRYRPVETAVEFVRRVRQANLPLRLITNNTTDDRPTLIEKLRQAGFDFALSELHTCITAAATHLRQHAVRRCLVLGNAALQRMFGAAGFEPVEDSRVDAVVVGLDTDLTYARLALACDAIKRHGARFVALHRNRVYTDAAGRVAPSVGALVAALAYATGAEPEVMGKPNPAYFRQALDELGLPAAAVLVVSDDPFSDLAGAKRLGMQTAFVLSGKYSDTDVLDALAPAERPDRVVRRIGDLLGAGVLPV